MGGGVSCRGVVSCTIEAVCQIVIYSNLSKTLIPVCDRRFTSCSSNDRGGDDDEPPVDSFLAGGRGGG